VEAAMEDVEAHVHHAAITKDQVEEYALPTEPAKDPEGDSTGAKAYESHKEKFRQYAGSYAVEIQAFSGRKPEAFREEIERYVKPYYDASLDKKIRKAVNEAQRELEEELRDRLEDQRDDISDAMEEAREAIETYDDELGDTFEEVKEALAELRDRNEEVMESSGLKKARDSLNDAVNIQTSDIPEEVEVEVPEGDVNTYHLRDPLLDTQRPFGEQLQAFKNFDIRDA
jgi:cellobiose-specific phosphotransferase system component IIA